MKGIVVTGLICYCHDPVITPTEEVQSRLLETNLNYILFMDNLKVCDKHMKQLDACTKSTEFQRGNWNPMRQREIYKYIEDHLSYVRDLLSSFESIARKKIRRVRDSSP